MNVGTRKVLLYVTQFPLTQLSIQSTDYQYVVDNEFKTVGGMGRDLLNKQSICMDMLINNLKRVLSGFSKYVSLKTVGGVVYGFIHSCGHDWCQISREERGLCIYTQKERRKRNRKGGREKRKERGKDITESTVYCVFLHLQSFHTYISLSQFDNSKVFRYTPWILVLRHLMYQDQRKQVGYCCIQTSKNKDKQK